ncbi:MAG TPA: hypothetical protein VFU13_18595 [Steroidobacteraceae bacterium]|nr:hypothetical protein [Steroidobacteraceae bacterium]
MINGLVDHLWQFCCCSGVAWAFSLLTRDNAAIVRLWLWRIAALKLLLPFSLLFALGAWMGYPSVHSADPTPSLLVGFFQAVEPIVEPARHFRLTGSFIAMWAVPAMAAAAACAWWIGRQLRRERLRVDEQARLREADPDAVIPSVGFWRAALLSACALVAVSAPLLAGAVADHQWRRDLLIVNSNRLRDAPVSLTKSPPGLGQRFRVIADKNGVLVRNASIRDLVAMAYGVNSYAVWANQLYIPRDDGEIDSWILSPRYDVRANAPILEPQKFDPYALRRPVSRLLADRFGLEIYVNGSCQPPCGVYQTQISAEPL